MKKEAKPSTLSQRKARLEQQSSHYRQALDADLSELKLDLRRWGRTSLIVAGSLYGVYKLVKLLRGSGEGPIEGAEVQKQAAIVQPARESVIVTKIKEQIALFLLAIALQKIKSFLDDKKDEESHSG
ncbi:MAG: hypothetical protein ACR2MX_12705 [Cyclobacteriaceae bacterium]